MKRKYELMLVLNGDIDEKDEKKHDEIITKLLGSTGVVVTEKKVLGKRQLSYPIAKKSEGLYVLLNLEGNAVKVGDLEAQTRLTGDVLRYLLIAQK